MLFARTLCSTHDRNPVGSRRSIQAELERTGIIPIACKTGIRDTHALSSKYAVLVAAMRA